MKALSIRQPYAWAILHAGKEVENRDWTVNNPSMAMARRLVQSGAEFLIHTGMGMTRAEYEDFLATAHAISRIRPFPSGLTLPAFDDLPRGGIVGMARIKAVVTSHASPWFFGPVGLVLANVQQVPFVPLKGALGFFEMEWPVQ